LSFNIDDVCAQGFNKEWRMFWAREFIREWLVTPEMQFPFSLDALTMQANRWILKSTDFNQTHPIVSSEDLKEAGLEILCAEE
jgi:hypothetical protein